MTSILLVIKILWIWRDFKLYFVILNFPDRTTREGGKSEYLLLGPSYMVFILLGTTLMKIRDFQKCKIHSSSLRSFRITACQSWCNSQSVKKLKVFIGGAVFMWKYAVLKKNLIFEKY